MSRIRANLAALKLLKLLEQEGRKASPEEKKILAGYSGWGADKEVFNDGMAEYREGGEYLRKLPMYVSWEKEYGKHYDAVKEALTEEEIRSARASTLNAHYTSEEVCHSLWDIAMRLGFQGGRVLEPAVGTGCIISAMPEALREKTKVDAVEKDTLTARLAAYLLPEAKVENAGFEDSLTPEASYDLVITNVPFDETGPGNQSGKVKYNLHNFFIARSMDKLKPGGVAVIITSASTLQNNPDQRAALAEKAKMLGAIRLPNDAFAGSANTQVVTDILVLRKPTLQADQIPTEEFRDVRKEELPPEGIHYPYGNNPPVTDALVNEYFVRNPQMVLGFHSMNGSMYGKNKEAEYTVFSPPAAMPLARRLKDAVSLMPEGVIQAPAVDGEDHRQREESARLYAFLGDKEGSYVVRDGALKVVEREEVGTVIRLVLNPPLWERPEKEQKAKEFKLPRGLTATATTEMGMGLCEIKEAFKRVVATDLNPVTSDRYSEQTREILSKAYRKFCDRWGQLNANPQIYRLFRGDPEMGALLALENVSLEKAKDGKAVQKITPAEILSKRTLFPHRAPDAAATISDAAFVSLSERGVVDPSYVAQLVGKPDDMEGVKNLLIRDGVAFENPETGYMESRAQYLSGNVVEKHEKAKAAAAVNPGFHYNVKALEAILPARVPFDQIDTQLGAAWLPAAVVSAYAQEVLDQNPDFQCRYYAGMSKWCVPEKYVSNVKESSIVGTPHMSGVKILDAALNMRQIRITHTDSEGNTFYNEKASNLANSRALAIREGFRPFLARNPQLQALIETEFNDKFNNVVLPVYTGDHLTFPGLSQGKDSMDPRSHQRDVVARLLAEQAGLIAHDVGFGKTFSLILTAMESKRLGLAQKPMIVCDNPSYPQFVDTFRKCYPQASILVAEEDSLSPKNRNAFLSRVATGNWDAVLVAQSHFNMIPNSPETQVRFFNAQIEELRAVIHEMDRNKESRTFVRRVEKAVKKLEERLKRLQDKMEGNQDNAMYWEQLGVDLLCVDEFHKYKKAPFRTTFNNVKGIDTTESQRGVGMLMKCQQIQAKRNGRGVIAATGTPVSNTMAEAWNMVRLTKPQVLEDFGVDTFDRFVTSFCRQESGLELNEANGKWRTVTRLSKFVNGTQFIAMVRSCFDVQMDKSKVNLNVPKLAGGQIQLADVELTEEVADIMDDISSIYEDYEKSPNKMDLSFVPIMLMQVGVAAAIDPRLIDPALPDNPESLVNRGIDNIVDLYNRHAGTKATQAVFLDRYRNMDTSVLARVRKGGLSSVKIELEDADALGEEGSASKASGKPEEPEKEPEFNLFEDIRAKLIARGIPAHEIALINEATDNAARKVMMDKINAGEIRVVMGSTMKLGTGVNIQKKLIAGHHFDPPRDMTPASLVQRNGRFIRQGNENPEVHGIYYGMRDTAIPGIFHRLQRKESFIAQVLSAKGVGVEFDDCGEVRLEEMKANLISDKRVLQRAELLTEIKELRVAHEVSMDQQRNLRFALDRYRSQAEHMETTALPRLVKLAEYVASNVIPGEKYAVLELKDRTVKGEEVRKVLEENLAEWKEKNLGHEVQRTMARFRLNGFPFEIWKELTHVGKNDTMLVAIVNNPVFPNALPLSQSRFASVDALFKVVQARHDEAIHGPDHTEAALKVARAERDKVQQQLDSFKPFDAADLERKEQKLIRLEQDMKENPMDRKGIRAQLEERKKRLAAMGRSEPRPVVVIQATEEEGQTEEAGPQEEPAPLVEGQADPLVSQEEELIVLSARL